MPILVTHTQNLSSAFNPSKLVHPEQWAQHCSGAPGSDWSFMLVLESI